MGREYTTNIDKDDFILTLRTESRYWSAPDCLNHCILVDCSTVICWTSPFSILGVSGLFCRFYSVLMDDSVSKQ